MAWGVCNQCGVPDKDRDDVADKIAFRARRIPPKRRLACAADVVRDHLAHERGIPRRRLPVEMSRLQAIGQYTAAERLYDGRDDAPWRNAFDFHSRRFAVENGVCPCCSRPGSFTDRAGRCECGFHYDS
jgi:hypothetical protein